MYDKTEYTAFFFSKTYRHGVESAVTPSETESGSIGPSRDTFEAHIFLV